MYTKDVERPKNGYKLPPAWCNQICRNAMNQRCIEACAPKRNARHFEIMEGINLEDLPRFPLHDWIHNMTAVERQIAAGVYLARVVDHAQGIRHEPPVRRNPYYSRNRPILEAVKKQGVSDGAKKGDSPHQDREEYTDSGNGLEKLAGRENTPE